MTSNDGKYYGEPIKYDPDFNGPLKRRSCTDIICLLLFIVFIGCWIGIGLYAFTQGDLDVLLVPKDSRGSRCGLDSHVANKPYLFFFDLTKCLQPIPFTGCKTPQVCVESCPNKVYLMNPNERFNPYDLICVDGVTPRSKQEEIQMVQSGKCAQWYLLSKPVLKRCLYNVGDRKLLQLDVGRVRGDEISLMKHRLDTADTWLALVIQNTISIFTNNDQIQQIGHNIVDDITSSWWQILVGLLIGLVTCIVYIVMMRWIAGIMVWISIFGVIGVLSYGLYFLINKFIYFRDHPISREQEETINQLELFFTKKDTWLVLAIINSIVLVIILLVLLFLRKRIVLAIALIKEASKAVSSITASLFFPIFPWCLQIGVIVYAVVVGLHLSTVGDPLYVVRNLSPATCICDGLSYRNDNPCDPQLFWRHCREVATGQNCTSASCHFEGTDAPGVVSYLHGFNVFGFFWLLFFVSAMSEMILAATFATWYWTFKKSNVPFFTVTEATLRTFRFHIGTLAFGSLIIAICRMIRVMLEYIDNKLKKYENPFTKAILCCCKCFFWCLENFLRFINRNAYIMCAIHGKNFCISAKDAFNLLMRNIIRVFVLDKVTDFLLFLSKVLITAAVTSLAYTIFATDIVDVVDNTELNYNLVPVIIIGIGTFFIATVFFSVFTMAVDTLFLCFLEDCERNDGSREKPYYMSKSLMKILGKKNKRN